MRASIITPTYNSVDWIAACVANVQAQGDAVCEHIVVDGGSTDGTVERIAQLLTKRPHLRFIPGPDRGQSDALNKGVAAASGEVIGVLNVDDTYQPDAVRRACQHLSTIRGPAFVVGICKIISPEETKWNRPKDLRLEALLLGYDYAQWPNNPAAYFYHRSVHEVIGSYDVEDHYTMDLDFIFRCASHVQMRYFNEYWGNFQLHVGCKTFDDTEGPIRQLAILKRFRGELGPRQKLRMVWIGAVRKLVVGAKRSFKHSSLARALKARLEDRGLVDAC